MNNKIINNLYDHFKNIPKKLKIICDWDEVIQACEPYALWLAKKWGADNLGETFGSSFSRNRERIGGPTFFKDFEIVKWSNILLMVQDWMLRKQRN